MIAYLKLFRFPLVFTAVADSAAGFLALRGYREGDALALACFSVTSAGLYCFGMAMNDVADRERDRRLAPGRPIPSGRVTLRGALTAAILLLGVSAGALAINPAATIHSWCAWGGALLCILGYDFAVKIPPVMGAIRACNFLIGASAGGDPMHSAIYPAMFGLLLYGTSLTFVSTLEDASLRKGVLRLGAMGMVAGALLPAAAHLPASWRGLVPAGVLVAWVVFRTCRAADKRSIMLMIRDGVAGFILLDASIVLRFQEPALGLAIVALLVPAFALVAVFKRLA